MKKTQKKIYSYRRKINSKKLRGGAGKLNTKKPQKNNKKRPKMTAQNYEEQLYKSFPYSFVLHGEVGTKAVKTQEKLEREYYESINQLNTNRKNKRSSVTGIPKQEQNSEGLMSAFAKGQQEGLVDHSRMMSATRRITQPFSRMTGVQISESPRNILAQGRTMMGPSSGTTKSFSSRGSKPSTAVNGTVAPDKASLIPGYVRMTGTKVMPGNTVMPGKVEIGRGLLPDDTGDGEAEFLKSGAQLPGAVEGASENVEPEVKTEQCPCCERVFDDGITINNEWTVAAKNKLENASSIKSYTAVVETSKSNLKTQIIEIINGIEEFYSFFHNNENSGRGEGKSKKGKSKKDKSKKGKSNTNEDKEKNNNISPVFNNILTKADVTFLKIILANLVDLESFLNENDENKKYLKGNKISSYDKLKETDYIKYEVIMNKQLQNNLKTPKNIQTNIARKIKSKRAKNEAEEAAKEAEELAKKEKADLEEAKAVKKAKKAKNDENLAKSRNRVKAADEKVEAAQKAEAELEARRILFNEKCETDEFEPEEAQQLWNERKKLKQKN
jgi:hypothetical protein